MNRVTQDQMRQQVDAAERELRQCWRLLASLRKRTATHRLLELQPKLTRTLLRLARTRTEIAHERKDLIARKSTLNPIWFARRMAQLKKWQDLLQSVAGIGKSIGDAFAWFFYQNDLALLSEHAQRPKELMLPTGVGGMAELEFVRHVRGGGDLLLLYHGITTILRIGDFSLVQIRPLKVIALGELKAGEREGDQVQVEAQFFGSGERMANAFRALLTSSGKSRSLPTKGVIEKLNPRSRARFRRQCERMSAAVSESAATREQVEIEVPDQYYLKELAEVVERAVAGRLTSEHVGGGLMLAVYRHREVSLHTRLRGQTAAVRRALGPNLSQVAAKMFLPRSRYNSFGVGAFHYAGIDDLPNLVPGTVPFFWLAVPLKVVENLFFFETLVVTVFNPAHLLQTLEDGGFTISSFKPPVVGVEWREGGKRYQLKNFSYFLRLIRESLFRESQVAHILRATVEDAKKRELAPGTRIDLKFSQRLLPPGVI